MDKRARQVAENDAPLFNPARDPLAQPQLVQAARERSMAERFELALSWNSVAAELRVGMNSLADAPGDPTSVRFEARELFRAMAANG